jgi:hypothetical protein
VTGEVKGFSHVWCSLAGPATPRLGIMVRAGETAVEISNEPTYTIRAPSAQDQVEPFLTAGRPLFLSLACYEQQERQAAIQPPAE